MSSPSELISGNEESFVTDLKSLQPTLRSLPTLDEPPVANFPGEFEGDLFVRRTPVADESATRAVYVHGMGGSSNNWTDFMYLMEPNFPGIALDLPGYGYSNPATDGKQLVDGFSDAVIRLIEAEGGKPVHLFGNSLGGVTSVAVAAKRPDLIKTMTLFAPAMMTRAVMAKEHLPKAWTILMSARKAKKMGADQLARNSVRDVLRLCYADPNRLPAVRREAMVDEVTRRLALPYNQEISTAAARALFDAAQLKGGISIWDAMASVKTPTFAIYGTEDKLVPVQMAPRLASTIRNGQVTILPDCGHVAQAEFPHKSAELVLQWMGSLES